MPPRRPPLVGADDYDDGYDDDDDYYDDDDDGYDEYDYVPQQAKTRSAAASSSSAAGRGRAASDRAPAPVTAARPKPAAPAAAAGASALAQGLCDSAPGRRPAAGQQQQPPLRPAAPSSSSSSGVVKPFAFDVPSPDDAAIAAGPKPRAAPAGVQLAPSRTPTAAGLSRRTPAAAGAEGLAGSMAGLAVGGSGSYRPDAALAKAVAAAAKADKSPLHLAVLGHVDAGKSTLMGRLLHDLGRVPAKEAHKLARGAAAAGKASFCWAWALDERAEERARGVTTDVALARFETPRHRVTLLDAPGHRDFVPEMIGGASQADAALLLVDASPGSFEAGFGGGGGGGGAGGAGGGGVGQTREHAQLARGMGVDQLAVVVTKLDAWERAAGVGEAGGGGGGAGQRPSAQERFESIKAAVSPFLRSCGFRDASVQWLPAVGPTGDNLLSPPGTAAGGAQGAGGSAAAATTTTATASPLASWWKGPTVVAAIDVFEPRPRLTDLPLRLPIHDVGGKGAAGPAGGGGLVVGGKVECGALAPGSRVVVVPGSSSSGGGGTSSSASSANVVLVVKSLEVGGAPAAVARAGDNVDVVLAPPPGGGGGGGASAAEAAALLFPGAVLCPQGFPAPAASRVTLRILLLPDLKQPLLRGAAVTLHAHTAREAARVTALVALLDRATGAVTRERPRFLTAGQAALVQVELARPVALEPLEGDMRALGRVALRLGAATAAVGVVVSVDDCGGEGE